MQLHRLTFHLSSASAPLLWQMSPAHFVGWDSVSWPHLTVRRLGRVPWICAQDKEKTGWWTTSHLYPSVIQPGLHLPLQALTPHTTPSSLCISQIGITAMIPKSVFLLLWLPFWNVPFPISTCSISVLSSRHVLDSVGWNVSHSLPILHLSVCQWTCPTFTLFVGMSIISIQNQAPCRQLSCLNSVLNQSRPEGTVWT